MYDIKLIQLDKKSQVPMYQQIGDSLCNLIEDGTLKANTKLPPIRKMASALKVNSVTIVSSYKYLENKKVVYSQIGSGTYVSELKISDIPKPIVKHNYITMNESKFKIEDSINFAASSTSVKYFPVEEFKILFNEVLDKDGGNAFSYQDSQGYLPLREAICTYLEDYGVKTTPEKIQIISGGQQGIDIVSKVMLTSGDYLFVEKPTYYGAVGAFLSRGAQIIEIPMDVDGIDIVKLESLLKIYKPKFIYVMPYFQTPTCISYSMKKKKELLSLAYKYDTYIIEEDNQSDFNYIDITIVPIKAIDYKNKVVYIKSFSKILMPGLRLGFMVLPKKILQQVLQTKYTTDNSTSSFIQRAFSLYLQGEEWLKHKAAMRNIFKVRYEITKANINKYLLQYVEYDDPKGGLNFWLKLKTINVVKLCNILLLNKVIVTPSEVFYMSGESMDYFRISFAAVEDNDIEKGIQIISQVIYEITVKNQLKV